MARFTYNANASGSFIDFIHRQDTSDFKLIEFYYFQGI